MQVEEWSSPHQQPSVLVETNVSVEFLWSTHHFLMIFGGSPLSTIALVCFSYILSQHFLIIAGGETHHFWWLTATISETSLGLECSPPIETTRFSWHLAGCA
jgi:hypothetical protein